MSVHEFDARVMAIHTLRVNIKALQAEARAIRRETRRAGPVYRDQLALHRRGPLRAETRVSNLALAFVRGVPYRAVEARCEKPIDRSRLINKIVRHWRVSLQTASVHAWLDADQANAVEAA